MLRNFYKLMIALAPLFSQDGNASDDPYLAARLRMVETQLIPPSRNIRDERVLNAMRKVPRHEFVPEKYRSEAYEDHPLPIGHGQTISQPYIVAFMTEKIAPKPTDRILEIGTGSGYQAAILAELAAEVYSIEIIEPLAEFARSNLQRLGYKNVHIRTGDGYLGWPEAAPFDAIIVTCAPNEIPPPLIAQLREGGRMIIPVGNAFQQLILLEKREGSLHQQAVLPVRFVPMTGKAQEPNPPETPPPPPSPTP
ncbi:MAG: protein-L-isoaspartate(D-aspartate) O-methyltransferase [Chthoniobacterales bacterium]|nr:protein-L-isoaspartate(D-aspartate) O-methyltransferase [Chthoniobacterales bacterium]